MKPEEGRERGRVGPFTIAIIVFLAANAALAILMGYGFLRIGHPAATSGPPAAGHLQTEEKSPPPSPVPPQDGTTRSGRREGANAPSPSSGERRAAPSLRDADRSGTTGSSIRTTAGIPAGEPFPEPVSTLGASRSPGSGTLSGPAAASIPWPSGRQPAGGSPGPPGSRTGNRASGSRTDLQATPPSSPPASPPPLSQVSAPSPPQATPLDVLPVTPPEAGQRGSEPLDGSEPAEGDPGSDSSIPTLGSLQFDPPEVADGHETTLLIQLTSTLSGQTRVAGQLWSPSGSGILPFDVSADSGGSVFAARFTMPSKAEAGVWYVASLHVLNRAIYFLTQTFTPATVPPGGKLRVLSQEPDTAAPEVRDISVAEDAVRDGETNLISISAEDGHSGVASVGGAFRSPSRSALVWFACHLDTASGLWQGDVSIPQNAECGQWTLQQVRAIDKAGNLANPTSGSPLVDRVSFEVWSRGDCDSIAPTMEAFDLSPRSVSSEMGGEIFVTATILDEGSGTESMFGWASGPPSAGSQSSRIYFTCTGDRDNREAQWTGKIVVPRSALKGTWSVGLVHLEDRARNARDYGPGQPILAEATFEVE